MTSPDRDAHNFPHVRCRRLEAHDPHTHVNEGPNGGCGLPEWCDGRDVLDAIRERDQRTYWQQTLREALEDRHTLLHILEVQNSLFTDLRAQIVQLARNIETAKANAWLQGWLAGQFDGYAAVPSANPYRITSQQKVHDERQHE